MSPPDNSLRQLACALQLLKQPLPAASREQVLIWYQTGLESIVRSQLIQGKWQPHHANFNLQLQLPTSVDVLVAATPSA